MFIQFIRKIMFLRSRWVDDATGLAPPCIAVLRSCHSLAASLTTIAGTVNSNTVPLEIVDVRAVIIQYCSTVLLFRITGYFCLGCSTHTASRGRCCPQSVSTIGCQAAGSQSGGSRIGCNSLGTGNQARCTEESSQETGIYWSGFERHGHTSVSVKKRSVGSRSSLLHSGLYASLRVRHSISFPFSNLCLAQYFLIFGLTLPFCGFGFI